MTLYAIIIFAAVISFLSIRSNFFGLKLMSGMAWFVLFMYLKDNPPGTVTEGSPVHTGMLVVTIGFGLMLVLAGLARGVKTNNTININGRSVSEESEGFRLPNWMKNITMNDISPEEKRRKTDDSLADYRQQLRTAYTSGKTKRGGR